MVKTFTTRDKQTSLRIHKLFWQANFVDWPTFIIWALTRPTALLIYNILIPFQIAYALQAIITRQFSSLNSYAWNVLFQGLTYCALWTIGGIAICRNGKIAMEYLQKKVFINYLHKDYEFYNTTFLGTLGTQATRLRDAFSDYCILFMNSVTKQTIIIGASAIIIASQSIILALVTLFSMLCILSFTLASGKWRLKYRRLMSEASSETAGIIGDALGHGTTVKAFASEEYETNRLTLSLKKLTNTQYWSWMSSIPADIGRMFLAAVATVLLLLLTAHLYQQHTISIAIVVLIQLYVIKLVMATQEIADTIKTYESIMSAALQAVKTMLITPTVLDSPNPKKFPKNAKRTIILKDVTYRYPEAPEGTYAIQNFTLEIKAGEKIGLVGYSGSGKTTLTKLLLRFMDLSNGTIKISNIDIQDINQTELRQNIAYVPQEPLLFHRSIKENIAYGKPNANQKSIHEAGQAAYIDEFVNEMRDGYDTIVGEKGVKLSGGQRQRVAIARALLKNAPILVLDEATSALDSKSEQYIQKALWHLMKNRTAIVIAHRLSTIQQMDRIVVMDKGKIVDIGTHQQLLHKPNSIYAKLWKHQSGGYLTRENIFEHEQLPL